MQVMTHHKMKKFCFWKILNEFFDDWKKVYFISLFWKISKNEWFNKFYKNEEKTQHNYVYNVILTKTNITISLRSHQCFRWWKIEKSVPNERWSVLICKSVQWVTYAMYYIVIIKNENERSHSNFEKISSQKYWNQQIHLIIVGFLI